MGASSWITGAAGPCNLPPPHLSSFYNSLPEAPRPVLPLLCTSERAAQAFETTPEDMGCAIGTELSGLTTGFASGMELAWGRAKASPPAIHLRECIAELVCATGSSCDGSSTAFSPLDSDSDSIVGSRPKFSEELWKSAEDRVKRYAEERVQDAHPLGPIGDGEDIALGSPAALAHFHDLLHHSTSPIRRDRVRSLSVSWPMDVPFSIGDAINLVCVLSQLSNLVSLAVNTPIHMPFPFVDDIRSGLSKALATRLMLDGLVWESHAGTREMARHNHVLPSDFLYVLDNFAALPNLRVLDTTLGFLTRLPERVCANITNLSVTIISSQQNEACATIERKFGRSLRRLKLTRLFKHAPVRESPVRICALLGAKGLESLEVVDRDMTGGMCRVPGPSGSDVLLGTEEGCAVANECPELRTIVWEPSWISQLADMCEIERATHRYQEDLLATFGSPIELYLRVNEMQGVRVALDDDGRYHKWPGVRDIEELQRWDLS